MKYKDIKINIQVIDINKILLESKKDSNYAAYINFEDSVLDILIFRGYDVEETYDDSDEGCKYLRYTYIKIKDDVKLRILVVLKIAEYFSDKANVEESCSKSIGDDGVYIIVNQNIYTSYEAALRYIEASLDELEEM